MKNTQTQISKLIEQLNVDFKKASLFDISNMQSSYFLNESNLKTYQIIKSLSDPDVTIVYDFIANKIELTKFGRTKIVDLIKSNHLIQLLSLLDDYMDEIGNESNQKFTLNKKHFLSYMQIKQSEK